jgi:hypothetical protein
MLMESPPRGDAELRARPSEPESWDALPAATTPVAYPGVLCEAIARLSDAELKSMTADELVHLIQSSPVIARESDGFRRLSWMSDGELLRIAALVRRCCRTRLNAFQRAQGRIPEWYEAC